jgi:hypothetical protein
MNVVLQENVDLQVQMYRKCLNNDMHDQNNINMTCSYPKN